MRLVRAGVKQGGAAFAEQLQGLKCGKPPTRVLRILRPFRVACGSMSWSFSQGSLLLPSNVFSAFT